MTRFSMTAYAELIEAGRASGYRYLTFGEAADGAPDHERLCLLRHDVDVSVGFALEMAQAEATAGVRSTYFLMPRSPAYNLLSRHASLAVREMVAMGHEVALHYDAAHPLVDDERLTDQIRAEAALVAELAGRPVRAFSFHQPSAEIIDRKVAIRGLINTYNPNQMQDWHYASDSNRAWRGQSGIALVRDVTHVRLQLLIHPMWWVCDKHGTEAVWDEAVKSNFEAMQRQFLETEGAYGKRRTIKLSRD